MWGMNSVRPVEIPKLNEQMAIELGAHILGEVIIYSLAAYVLVGYFSQEKEEAEENQENDIEYLGLQAIRDSYIEERDFLMENKAKRMRKQNNRETSEAKQQKPVVEDKPPPPVPESADIHFAENYTCPQLGFDLVDCLLANSIHLYII